MKYTSWLKNILIKKSRLKAFMNFSPKYLLYIH